MNDTLKSETVLELSKKCDQIIASKLKLYEGVTGDDLVICQAWAYSLEEAIPMIQKGYDENDSGDHGAFVFTVDDVKEIKPQEGFYSYKELAF